MQSSFISRLLPSFMMGALLASCQGKQSFSIEKTAIAENTEHVLAIYLQDTSESALNDAAFMKESKAICHGFATALNRGDLYTQISISAEVTATDPEHIKSQTQLHKQCQKKLYSSGQGTFSCPAWQLALDLIEQNPNYRPVVVSHIQANELEIFCSQRLQALAKQITARQGQFVVIGSTNEGGTQFNSTLWKTLKYFTKSHIKLYNKDGKQNAQEAINTARLTEVTHGKSN